MGPSTYPSLLNVKGRAMIPAPMVLLTMIVVVKKKSTLREPHTCFCIVGVTGQNAALLVLISTELTRMNVSILLSDRGGSPERDIVI